MPAKSKSSLNTDITTNFADNTAGDITAEDARNFFTDLVDSTLGGYGALYVTGGTAAQSLNTTPAKLTAWTVNGVSANCTPDHATNNNITALIAGDYLIMAALYGTGTGTDEYIFYPYVQAAAVTGISGRFTQAGTGAFLVTIMCTATLAANHAVSIYGVSNQSSGSNYTLIDGQLVIKRIS